MKSFLIRIKPIATFCIYITSIFGFLILIINVAGWIYKKATFKDIAGIARPICERFPFNQEVKGTMPSQPGRIIGVSLLAENDISDVRIQISDSINIINWGMTSDTLSISEQNEFLSKLPKGESFFFISPPLPPLVKDSTTTLVALVAVSEEGICINPNWLKVSANKRKFLYVNNLFFTIRGLSIGFDLTTMNLFFISFILAIGIAAIIKRNQIYKFLKIGSKTRRK